MNNLKSIIFYLMVVKKFTKKLVVVISVVFLIVFIGFYYTGKFTEIEKLTIPTTITTSIPSTLITSIQSRVKTTSTQEGLTGVVLQTEDNSNTDCEDLGCPAGTQFVGSKNSNKYHYCDCRWVKMIKPDNLVCFKNVEEAKEKCYIPCKTCEPPE